jgi:hypothetical protein
MTFDEAFQAGDETANDAANRSESLQVPGRFTAIGRTTSEQMVRPRPLLGEPVVDVQGDFERPSARTPGPVRGSARRFLSA